MKEIEKFSMKARKSRKRRSQFKSRSRYQWVKAGSPFSRTRGIGRHVQGLFAGVDACDLFEVKKAEKEKKESA